jgi:long-chain acyl-CoA synthetase
MTALHDWTAPDPAKPALIEAETGKVLSYGELARDARRIAAWLIQAGLAAGDGIAMLMENREELIELACGARLGGLYYTCISTQLAPDEIRYIVQDSGSRLLLVSRATAPKIEALVGAGSLPGVQCFCVDGATAGFADYRAALARFDGSAPLPERPLGRDLLYSSGTTGRPKGIRRPMTPFADRDKPDVEVEGWRRSFFFDDSSVYLSTAPLYHAAPLRYVMRTLGCGGTCVVMRKFDPEAALSLIQTYRATHTQWVPTMFVRLLKLPEDVRRRYDLSSQRVAVHAAAPCPVDVKHAMFDWWGDVLYEYYAGSEGAGATSIGPLEWRAHPGSVGRAMVGKIHILDDEGRELPTGEAGGVYFSDVPKFAYLNDPEKTRGAHNDRGWATYGDIGYLDAEGYLYLCDRRTDLILSGGVNVYPQEIESVLVQHPAVEDAAVIGVPDEEFGEVPKAVIRLRDPALASSAMAEEIAGFCAERMSRLKLPRSIVFEAALPRLETGKLLRRVLKDRYREAPQAGHVVRPPARTA